MCLSRILTPFSEPHFNLDLRFYEFQMLCPSAQRSGYIPQKRSELRDVLRQGIVQSKVLHAEVPPRLKEDWGWMREASHSQTCFSITALVASRVRISFHSMTKSVTYSHNGICIHYFNVMHNLTTPRIFL